MNIALCTISPLRHQKEATTITTLNLAQFLSKAGHQIFILAKKVEDLPDYEEINGIPLHRQPLLSYHKTIQKIQKEKNLHFQIIHSFSASPLFVFSGWLAKLHTKAKLIHTLKSYPRDKYNRYFYFLLNLADQVTVPTTIFAQKLKGVKKNKIKIVRSFIDLQKFQPQDQELLKNKYNYSKKKILFYYGSMAPWKGPQVLIEALPQIIKEIPNLQVLFAPRSGDEAKHIQRVHQLGLSQQVQFITNNIPIEEYVNMADIVVLPYLSLVGTEGNPSCLLEAMAAKTAVVTTNLPELKEIVIPGEDILMAQPNNISSLAENIIRLLKDPQLRTKLIENAFLKVGEFSTEKVVKELITLYQYHSLNNNRSTS